MALITSIKTLIYIVNNIFNRPPFSVSSLKCNRPTRLVVKYMNSLIDLNMTGKIEPQVGKTWRGGANSKCARSASILTTIPASLTHKYHLENPANIIFIPTKLGILIKKLEVSKNV